MVCLLGSPGGSRTNASRSAAFLCFVHTGGTRALARQEYTCAAAHLFLQACSSVFVRWLWLPRQPLRLGIGKRRIRRQYGEPIASLEPAGDVSRAAELHCHHCWHQAGWAAGD